MFLPPLAHLPRILNRLHDLNILLTRALLPAEHYKRTRGDFENDLRLSIILHAINGLHAARAILVLGTANMGGSVHVHCRVVFEALVKIRWMRKDACRATRFLQSEPFQRYFTATERIHGLPHFMAILNDCRRELQADPSLYAFAASRKKKQSLALTSYADVARALVMPKMLAMLREIGMDQEDYLLSYAIPSQYPHSSPIHVRNFAVTSNQDSTARISTDEDNSLLVSYCGMALPNVGNILVEALSVFPDGAIEFESEKCAQAINELIPGLNLQLQRERTLR